MVYFVKYVAKELKEDRVCDEPKASLYSMAEREHHKRIEDECFGIPRGSTVVGLAIGIIIILVGSIWFLQQAELIPETVEIWPFALIIFGILILVGAIYGLRRRY